MVSADCFSRIGTSHTVCQDYGYAGMINDSPVCIVSDGCSSAKETDWGSRLLTNALKQQFHMPSNLGCMTYYHSAIRVAESNCRALQIPIEALTATLLCIKKQENFLDASLSGDGFIIARRRADKMLTVIQYEFSTNAPNYLRYSIDPTAQRLYNERFGKGHLITKTWNQLGANVSDLTETKTPLREASLINLHVFRIEDFDLVAVLSDGLHSFLVKELAKTHMPEALLDASKIIEHLFDFKSYAGKFVQRRCGIAFEEFQKLGWGNYDDFTMGAVYHD